METNPSSQQLIESEKEEEEEYVVLDLDSISDHIRIPAHAPYVLSGLDTVNPILVIDNKIKLIGEYEETIGTCLVFNESVVQGDEAGSSEGKQTPAKQVNPMARLNKVLKFRLYLETVSDDAVANITTKPS